ncbi:hypothetical protein K9X45_004650 [Salmonella enterica]|nr:hypothetical protein [Salmonella enterica]EGR7132662.1 hypothetical protein [Salmonella enterica subsp. enterica serovar Muenchen]EEC3582643.1 hypothetical protein [Salmonella enterica]EEO2506309.1 hypothetical protein [Salmonella enterica]EEO5283676.1 hypothetical protein [Salmonella enterica]
MMASIFIRLLLNEAAWRLQIVFGYMVLTLTHTIDGYPVSPTWSINWLTPKW